MRGGLQNSPRELLKCLLSEVYLPLSQLVSLGRSQDEFVVSDENPDESEEDPPSNEDSDTDFCGRRLRRHPSRPMRQSRRLRRKTPKKKYSDDDEEEESEENSQDSGKDDCGPPHGGSVNS